MVRRLALGFAILLLFASSAHARTLEARAGLSVDPDQAFFGMGGTFPAFGPDLRMAPNVEVGFGDHLLLVAMNAEVHYVFSRTGYSWTPYAGGGLGINYVNWDEDVYFLRDDSEIEVGLNLVGGIERQLVRGNTFFLEMKLGLSDSPDFKFLLGISL